MLVARACLLTLASQPVLPFLCALVHLPPTSAMAEPAQKKARTTRTFLFSSESVNEGPMLSMLLGSLEALAGIEQQLEATRTRSATKSRMLSWMPA